MTIAALLRAKHVGIKELKNRLSELLKTQQPLVATDRGQPAYFMIPYEEMIELVEMLEELSDPETLRQVAEGRKAYRKGGWVPVSNLWKKLASAAH